MGAGYGIFDQQAIADNHLYIAARRPIDPIAQRRITACPIGINRCRYIRPPSSVRSLPGIPADGPLDRSVRQLPGHSLEFRNDDSCPRCATRAYRGAPLHRVPQAVSVTGHVDRVSWLIKRSVPPFHSTRRPLLLPDSAWFFPTSHIQPASCTCNCLFRLLILHNGDKFHLVIIKSFIHQFANTWPVFSLFFLKKELYIPRYFLFLVLFFKRKGI